MQTGTVQEVEQPQMVKQVEAAKAEDSGVDVAATTANEDTTEVPPPPTPRSRDDAEFDKLRVETNTQSDMVIYSALVVATIGLMTMLSLAIIRACFTVLTGSGHPKHAV
jgi:hypothetical protein